MLIATTACALLLATIRPTSPDQVGLAFLLTFIVAVILFNDWSVLDLSLAQKKLQSRDYAGAAAVYTRMIQARPAAPDRYCYRAVTHIFQNDLDAAEADYAEAIRHQPRYVPAWEGKAHVEFRRRNYQRAIDHATIALCLAPGSKDAAMIRGAAYAGLGNFEAALADLDEAVAAAPDSWPACRWRAHVYFRTGNYRAVIDNLSYFPEAWKGDESVGIELAVARFKVGDHRTAIEIIETVLAEHPPSNTALTVYALFLATCPNEELRDGRRALELAQRAEQLPSHEQLPCLAALAAAYAELGQFDRAVEYGRRAVEAAPSGLRVRHEARLALYEAQQPYRDWPQGDSRPENV